MCDPAPVGPLVHRCQKCNAVGAGKKLLRCRGCLAVRYCDINHLKADLPSHKPTCNRIRKARVKLGKEAALVRDLPADGDMPENIFENGAGDFWRLPGTKKYMKARYNFAVKYLYMLGTFDSTQMALRHMQDMLRLDRYDENRVAFTVPFVMMCLDLDQESCDFIKGCLVDPRETFEGTDIFGSVESILGKIPSFEHTVASLLLRLKLLVDVINVIKARKVLSRIPLPVELQNVIEQNVVRSPLSAHLYKESTQALPKTQQKRIHAVCDFGSILLGGSEWFLSELFAVEQPLNIDPEWIDDSYTARNLARHSYPAWRGTEGVLQLLTDARACAVKALEIGLEEYKHPQSMYISFSDKAWRLTWKYLEWAVEDATYLGPPSERPSERYVKHHQEFKSDTHDKSFGSELLEGLRRMLVKTLYGAS
ncbi:unnamed protein product [Clonostachys rosea f. rosea IK726]|uniref:MYND-type domain-containing protein n=2 Tax=Bionectria ochroleuca TaxID=29856 RepID=A0A0B7KAU8_BIOOC|nr:unnamed protein product [Clonostachys rosea f. rosea IK726]